MGNLLPSKEILTFQNFMFQVMLMMILPHKMKMKTKLSYH